MTPFFDQSKFVKKAKSGVQEALTSPDHLLVQVVGAIDETTKMANLAGERLSEWYALHFPEFRTNDQMKYAQVALAFDRVHPDAAALNSILGENGASSVLQKAKTSVGVVFSPADMESVRSHAKLFISMQALREQYEKYQEELATRLCPNMSYLAGAPIAAKLVAQAGGLMKLATLPASTVQVLGAEKALFKHLKSGSPPPKHGLIFQHPLISTAPKRARGKLSRALAAKIVIASKADAFSHHFIAEKLKEQFDARAKTILEHAASEPERRGPIQSYRPHSGNRMGGRPPMGGNNRGGFGGSQGGMRPQGGSGPGGSQGGNRPQGGNSGGAPSGGSSRPPLRPRN